MKPTARLISILSFFTAAVAPLGAQTWNNLGTDWGTTANWTVSVPDTNTETATFGSSGSPVNPNLAAEFTIKALTFNSSAANYTFTGSKLTFDVNDTTLSNRIQVLNGTQTFDLDISVMNSASASVATRWVLGGSGTVNFSAGRTLTLERGMTIQATGGGTGSFNFYGNVVVQNGANLTHQGGGTTVYFREGSSLTGSYANSVGDTFFETADLDVNQLNMIGSLAGNAAFYISKDGLNITNNVRVGNTNANANARTIGVNISGGGTGTWSGQIDVSQNTTSDSVRTVKFSAAANNRMNLTGKIISTSALTDEVQITGGGIVAISGATNTYNTLTTVDAGTTLLANNVSGSATGANSLTVSGILGGTGRISPSGAGLVTISSGGSVAPGDGGIGALTLDFSGTTGGATFENGAGFSFDIGVAGATDSLLFTGLTSGSDEIVFNGNSVTLTAIGSVSAGTYTLFSFDQSGAYTGTLVTGTLAGFDANLVYNATDIQLVLTVSAIPEPSTAAALAGAALLGFAACRRRRG